MVGGWRSLHYALIMDQSSTTGHPTENPVVISITGFMLRTRLQLPCCECLIPFKVFSIVAANSLTRLLLAMKMYKRLRLV